MPTTPAFSPDEEALIQQKQEEFQKIVAEHQKRFPGEGFGIDPGPDPLAREALTRLVEENLAQALAQQTGTMPDPAALQRMKADLREQFNTFLARSTSPGEASPGEET